MKRFGALALLIVARASAESTDSLAPSDADIRKILVHRVQGTAGYLAFIGCNPKTRTGVVVLSNAQPTIGIDDIGATSWTRAMN